MNKYNLIIAKDWTEKQLVVVTENEMQEFIQKVYENNWIILRCF